MIESGDGSISPISALNVLLREVFAPLVGALVFKTSGGFEQSSQWVRFPYTPVFSFELLQEPGLQLDQVLGGQRFDAGELGAGGGFVAGGQEAAETGGAGFGAER